jgi:nucleoside-diphosphate-sugar epimerase
VLEGTKAIPITSRYCDVRDAARAHILAAEVPGARGRYLVSHESTVPSKFVSDTLQVRVQQTENAQTVDAAVTLSGQPMLRMPSLDHSPCRRCDARPLLLEKADKQGRVFVCGRVYTVARTRIPSTAWELRWDLERGSGDLTCVSDGAQERFPEADIAQGPDDTPHKMFDMSKTESELGLRLTPLKETLVDMAITLINLGVAQLKPKSNGAT